MIFVLIARERTKPMNLEWNVWRNELNTDKIQPFNVFNHYSFNKGVTEIVKKRQHMGEYEERIDKEAM